ncbi:MAG: DUF484 family protein [Oceanobacter sp.]|jgi:uncharacterized protein YigA (DUF484 family)
MTESHQVSATDVAHYLKDNPDFFVGRDELLAELRIPHDSGGATSLIERQLQVHRERNQDLADRLYNLLKNARNNDKIFLRMRRLVLALIEANSWANIYAALDDSLRTDFGVDGWAMAHFTERRLEAPLTAIKEPTQQRKILKLFNGRKAICGNFSAEEVALLMSAPMPSAKSIAAARISGQDNNGILVLASKDAEHYRSSTDTLFLDYLAEVLALRLQQTPVLR